MSYALQQQDAQEAVEAEFRAVGAVSLSDAEEAEDPDKTQPEEKIYAAIAEARESSGGADEASVPAARSSTSSTLSAGSAISAASATHRLKSEDIEDIKNFCATQINGCDDVVTLAKATLSSLQALWEEIGLDPPECASSTAEMFDQVKRVFENKLSSTQEMKCSLVSQVRLASARITTIEREIGTPEAESRAGECQAHTTLRTSLVAHKEYLKSLEATKLARASTLSKKADELRELFFQLEDTLSADQTKFLKLGSDYTMGRIDQLDARIAEQAAELASRQAQRTALVAMIRDLWDQLGLHEEWAAGKKCEDGEEVDEVIKAGAEEDLKVTLDNLEKLRERISKLQEEKAVRKEEQMRLFAHLATLWERVRTPGAEADAFKTAHLPLTLQTLEKIEVEIARLEDVKRAMMKELILETRGKLDEVWVAMRYSDSDKEFFRPYYEETYTEEMLTVHEEHLEACKVRLETMQPILKMFDRRAFILSEDEAMHVALKDPNRLLGRGRGMADQLKKEEKVRMMVNKELPKLLEKLRDAAHEYETTLGLQLKVEGQRIIDVLDAADESSEAAKHEAQARKMEKSMKPAVPVAGGLDTSTAANTSMAAPAARDMTRKLTPRDRDPSQERPGSAGAGARGRDLSQGTSKERGVGTSKERPALSAPKKSVGKVAAPAKKSVGKVPLASGSSKANAAGGTPDLAAGTKEAGGCMPPPPAKTGGGAVFGEGGENEGGSSKTGFGFKAKVSGPKVPVRPLN